ncbi:MAG TPA: polymer-forming cytoskeletal protein [Rhizomicrobium sp.]|nr:polymer-forming cytoskeletal protein [Rhizomicrobium sp.]
MTLFNRSDRPGDPAGRGKPDQSPKNDPPQAATLTKLESAAPKPVEAKAADVKPAEPPIAAAKPALLPTPTQTKTGASMPSVISKALKITGELESTEDIQIDGQIEGDVRGVGVKIGQNARVKGTVYGDEVELAGTIEGRIESKKVILAGTARMTGDVWHQEIRIESGAYISGNLKPDLGKTDAKPAHKPAVVATAGTSPTGNAAAAAHH